MAIQIDQSIKMEQTNKGAVLAFSNDEQYSILIPGKVKRQLQELFRKKGRPRIFVYRTFAAGVALLLQNYLPKFDRIIIDQEYVGKERMIRGMIYEILGRFCDRVPEIVFKKIGRKSNAHKIAYLTACRKKKPCRIVKFNEIKKLVFP